MGLNKAKEFANTRIIFFIKESFIAIIGTA